jgi:hypothetical protein
MTKSLNIALIDKIIGALNDPKNAAHFAMVYFEQSLKTGEPRYRQEVVPHHCDTAFCIGGWAIHLTDPQTSAFQYVDRLAAEVLGMPEDQAHDLFYPDQLCEITPQIAVETLQHLKATGKVKWPHL